MAFRAAGAGGGRAGPGGAAGPGAGYSRHRARAPVSRGCQVQPGEDGRIDFYLVTAGQKLSRGAYTGAQAIDLSKDKALGQAPWEEVKGTVSSGFAVVLRPESLPKGDSFKSVLAHELFHVLQFAHNTTLSCPTFWFLEASAKWAEWYFVPDAAGRMVYPWFKDFQDKPQVSLTDSRNKVPYSDWAWPLFMQQQAPLAAQYRQIPLVPAYAGEPGGGGSVEFDFSGLSPAGNADVTLLAADGQKSGYATNNGTWQRIDLGGGDTHAKICLNADATKKNRPLNGAFYVIIDNHSSGPSAATVTGSYTVDQQPYVCAKALSGSLTVTEKDSFPDGSQQNRTANLKININSENSHSGIWLIGPGSTWTEQYTNINNDPNCSGTSSGKLTNPDIGTLDDTGHVIGVSLYNEPYSVRPFLTPVFLTDENGAPCDGVPVPMLIGFGCPASFHGSAGAYIKADAGINFACSSTITGSETRTETVSGTLTATDPIECGLWTKNCSIGSSTMTPDRTLVTSGTRFRRM